MSVMECVARIGAAALEVLTVRLANEHGQPLRHFPIADYIRLLEPASSVRRYRLVPEAARDWCRAIERACGPATLELYHRAVLAQLIAGCGERLGALAVPESIVALTARALQRIVEQMDVTESGYYRHENDLFAKDLAQCQLRLLQCGSELVAIRSGVPRRVLFCDGTRQFSRAARFFSHNGGFRPWYGSHWDRRLIREFTPNAYDQCYLRMAQLLEFNPPIRGVMSSSWWFDPALEHISPDLVFLRRVPEENGAQLFKIGTSEDSARDALLRSPERKRLHEAGKYRPTVYLLAWARHDMLAWARQYAGR